MDREEVKKILEKENVKFIQMQFMDVLGTVKTVIVPSSKFDKSMDDGVLFDGSSILGYATIEESDMRGIPDLNTFQILPWYDGNIKTARIICDIHTPGGEQFPGDPRFVLKKMLKKANDMGYQFFTGPEFEFFLFKMNEYGEPEPVPSDRGSYFDYTPVDRAEAIKKEILLYLDMIGYDPEASHHEVSPGQHEIDLRYADAILNSSVNSYKRLVPGYEAPVYISWANMNRSALVRIPQGRGTKTRIEQRNPDPAGNPYLQFAVMLAAGLDGIKNRIEPPEPVEKDIYHLSPKERENLGIESLPGSLGDALELFRKSKLMRETLGDHISEHFYIVKSKEVEAYRAEVTAWEIKNLLPVL